ncbi:MAG: hypothetical protein IJW13_00725 [Clostridia bacterium]|nr:hypothetical protein [Clostridia bacterium]
MKKFSYKFTNTIKILFVIGLIVALLCIVVNAKRFYELLHFEEAIPYNFISAALPILIGVLAFVFIIPAITSSCYIIDGDTLISKWGLVKSKTSAFDIERVTHFRKTDKLVVSLKDQTYFVICIKSEEYDSFVDCLKQANKKIFFALNTENDGEK